MKLGLITDIHERLETLHAALECFARNQVDQVVVIGDLTLDGSKLQETCNALARAGAVGVWGNHDFGHCQAGELEFMSQLKPRLVLEDCLFTHVEPWLDTEDLADLWFLGGRPETSERIEKIFGAAPQRVLFAGHCHRWLAATPTGILAWQGERPISLAKRRHYVVVGAACDGHWATYETATGLLTPYSMAD